MSIHARLALLGSMLAMVAGVTLAAANAAQAHDRVVEVHAGDTLGGIALRTGVPVERIVRLNDLADPDHIEIGQRLVLRRDRPASTPRGIEHRVLPGETLSGIALHYGVSVAALAAANDIADPSYVQAGATLSIPTTSAGAGSGIPASMQDRVARRDRVRQIIIRQAHSLGVPAAFALAVAWQESGWQQGVTSGAGAVGVMQLLPSTGSWVAQSILGEPVNVWRTRSNVRAGVALLAFYLDRYGGSRSLALAAYYQGMTATDRWGVYPITRPYVASILALEEVFRS